MASQGGGQGDKEDRTEPASQRRIEQARDAGNVPVSREVAALAGLAATTLMLLMAGPDMAAVFTARLARMLADAPTMDLPGALASATAAAAGLAAPLCLAGLGASAASVLLQTSFLIKTSALMPDPGRLDPRRGFSRIFGPDGLMNTGQSIVKLAILGWAVWSGVSGALPGLAGAMFWEPALLASHLMRQLLHLMLVVLGVQTLIAGADVAWVRYRHGQGMKMSRQDLKQEAQETEGNPHVKGKLRRLRMSRARRRMLAAVPAATVVVTNPTHYAIALVYDRNKSSAPRLVAKGVDEVAARIRDVAKQHGVPLVASPPLARALYALELEAEIPAEHFQAVAQIIAYVWRLRSRARRVA